MKYDKRWHIAAVVFVALGILRANQVPYVLGAVPEKAVLAVCFILSIVCYALAPIYPAIKVSRHEKRKWQSIKHQVAISCQKHCSQDQMVMLTSADHPGQLLSLRLTGRKTYDILWMDFVGQLESKPTVVLARRYVFSLTGGRGLGIIRMHGSWRTQDEPELPPVPTKEDFKLFRDAYMATEEECQNLVQAISTWDVAATRDY